MLAYNEYEQVLYAAAYGIIILIALILRKYLKDKDLETRRIPLSILGAVLAFLEILKQLKNILGYDCTSLSSFIANDYSRGFSSYALPFHFCSFFIFFIIGSILAKGKAKVFFSNMSFLWSSFIAIFLFFYPASIMGSEISHLVETGELTHSVLFHLLAMAYFIFEVALQTTEFSKKDFWNAPVAFLVYGALAIPAAWIFEANYCSIYYPDFFAFLVPIYDFSIVVYETVLVTIGCTLSIGIFFLIIGIRKLEKKLFNHIKSDTIAYGALLFAIIVYPMSFIYRFLYWNGIFSAELYFFWLVFLFVLSCVPFVIYELVEKKKVNQ